MRRISKARTPSSCRALCVKTTPKCLPRARARLGAGEFIVVETDESDALFLTLSPVIEVITNIDADHMERYVYDFAQLKQAFIDFTQRLPFYGIAVLCIDDPHVRDILPGVSNK